MNNSVTGYKLILGYLGVFITMIGGICLLPLLVIPFYPDEAVYAKYFILPGVLSIFIGYLLYFYLKDKDKGNLEKHQDAILIVTIWILAIIISAIPFMLTEKYNFTQSIFEATSGYSTTGLSVVDVDTTPHIFLLFRSIMLFFGGVGLVLVLTSAISDRYGMRLYTAEGHSDKLLPNLVKSARLILTIYLGYIIIGTIMYIVFGMKPFDAINHSIASLSTGGFSTKSSSIGFYNSLPIEIITIVLMILGSTNFIIHLCLLKGQIKRVLMHVESKLFIYISIIVIPLLTLSLYKMNTSASQSLRISIFQFVSAITTTGFQTVPTFKLLPSNFVFLIILFMIIGGGMGSTAGGIKQYRIVTALKSIYYNIKEKLSNKKVIKTNFINKAGNLEVLTTEEINNNNSFLVLYLSIFIIGTLIYTSFGYSLSDSMFEFSSSLGTVGLSVGITGYSAHPIILWTSIVGMFIGRLEIMVIFIAFIRLYKDLSKK